MHISQIEPWTFFAKQNRQEKNNWKFELKIVFVLIFEFARK